MREIQQIGQGRSVAPHPGPEQLHRRHGAGDPIAQRRRLEILRRRFHRVVEGDGSAEHAGRRARSHRLLPSHSEVLRELPHRRGCCG